MKQIFKGKIRLVLAIAVCVMFVAVVFSCTAREPLNGSKFVNEHEDVIKKSSNPTPRPFRPLPLPEWFYKIFNYDWNYWSNPPHLYTIPEGNIGIGITNPTAKFEVGGTIKAESFVGDGACITNIPYFGVSSIINEGNELYCRQHGEGRNQSDYESPPINASDLNNTKYLKINILGIAKHVLQGTVTSRGYTKFQIETRDFGGVYSPSMHWAHLFQTEKHEYAPTTSTTIPINIEWIHELTSSEKTKGVQVWISCMSEIDGEGFSEFAHMQTVIMPI